MIEPRTEGTELPEQTTESKDPAPKETSVPRRRDAVALELRALRYAAVRAARALYRRPVSVVLAVSIVAFALVLIGVARLVDRNVERLTHSWPGDVQMVVYLDQSADRSHADRISQILRGLPAVEKVHYVPREEALDRLRSAFGERDDVLQGIEIDMLPASLEVTLGSGVRDVAAAHPVVQRLESTAGVDEVELQGDWVDRASALLGGLRRAAVLLFVGIGLAGVLIIAATMRLGTPHRRREARLIAVCGGSDPFLRGPIVLEGITQGVIAALLAVTALWGIYAAGVDPIESTLSSAFGTGPIAFLTSGDLALLLVAGAGLGVLGGLASPGVRARG
jgi:cell division transport system permease protein